jgi:hypothetical protein
VQFLWLKTVAQSIVIVSRTPQKFWFIIQHRKWTHFQCESWSIITPLAALHNELFGLSRAAQIVHAQSSMKSAAVGRDNGDEAKWKRLEWHLALIALHSHETRLIGWLMNLQIWLRTKDRESQQSSQGGRTYKCSRPWWKGLWNFPSPVGGARNKKKEIKISHS